MLQYITKDMLTIEQGILCHGVNTQGKMAAGLAKAIRKKWPGVYQAYVQNGMGSALLGQADIIQVDNEGRLFVANCYTQIHYGHKGRYADPEAIYHSLNTVSMFAHVRWQTTTEDKFLPVYLPKIGCGLGGLDWETDVEPIVNQLVEKWKDIEFYVCEV